MRSISLLFLFWVMFLPNNVNAQDDGAYALPGEQVPPGSVRALPKDPEQQREIEREFAPYFEQQARINARPIPESTASRLQQTPQSSDSPSARSEELIKIEQRIDAVSDGAMTVPNTRSIPGILCSMALILGMFRVLTKNKGFSLKTLSLAKENLYSQAIVLGVISNLVCIVSSAALIVYIVLPLLRGSDVLLTFFSFDIIALVSVVTGYVTANFAKTNIYGNALVVTFVLFAINFLVWFFWSHRISDPFLTILQSFLAVPLCLSGAFLSQLVRSTKASCSRNEVLA